MTRPHDQLLRARDQALVNAGDFYARAARAELRGPDPHWGLIEVLRCAGDRSLLDARAITGELAFEGRPILLAPLPDMHA